MPVQSTCGRAAVAVGSVVLLLASAGCRVESERKPSDEAKATPSKQGAPENDTTVKNASIVPKYANNSCEIPADQPVELKFFIMNNRHNEAERLLSVTTPAADSVIVAPGPTLEIPAGEGLAVGDPNSLDHPFTASLQGVNDNATPGQTVEVIFKFEDAGNIRLQVPVEACPAPTP